MILSHHKSGEIDPIAHSIVKHIDSKLPIVVVTRLNNYVFNEDLYKIIGKWVLVDFSELDWNWDQQQTHIWGKNTRDFKDKYPGEEWEKFDLFVKKNPPALQFIRELVAKDETDTIKSIEYPCWHNIPEPLSEEAFNNRPLEVFYNFGYSHEDRRRVHGEIWTNAQKYGYMVCDNMYYFDGFMTHETAPRKWVSIHIPHYKRVDISNILALNSMAKLSLSMSGAGVKCFRHCEASVNAIMCLPEDNLKWSYDWIDGVNCIRLKKGQEIKSITDALQRTDLSQIYLNGLETVKKYRISDYCRNYIEPLINNA